MTYQLCCTEQVDCLVTLLIQPESVSKLCLKGLNDTTRKVVVSKLDVIDRVEVDWFVEVQGLNGIGGSVLVVKGDIYDCKVSTRTHH